MHCVVPRVMRDLMSSPESIDEGRSASWLDLGDEISVRRCGTNEGIWCRKRHERPVIKSGLSGNIVTYSGGVCGGVVSV